MEVWKDCVDYPDLFEVSNLGNFRNKRNKRVLKQTYSHNGYPQIPTKIGGRKGKYKTFKVHREVAKAFLENPNNLPCVNHKDGVKTNNSLDNLEWVTHSENSIHAYQMGLTKVPINHSKLTDAQKEFVKQNYIPYNKEFGASALGRIFCVDKQTILRTVHNIQFN